MRLSVNRFAPLAALTFLAACGGGGGLARDLPPEPANGPAADYPMVVGAPFVVDGKTYTPVDTMNYDAVGYAGVGAESGAAITGAHRTLPLPSYVEVTSLDSGRTILVRLERRGPMTGSYLVDLSTGASAQLGITGQGRVAIRVRRVNPPESERAMLRTGQTAPLRMDTPKSLLAVLTRKLDQQEGVVPPPPKIMPSPEPGAAPAPVPVAVKPIKPKPKPAPVVTPTPADPATPPVQTKPKPAAQTASQIVQVAVFSTRERAETASAKLGGQVSQSGQLWRVRLGPFTAGTQAAAALAKAKAAGYRDARIQRAD